MNVIKDTSNLRVISFIAYLMFEKNETEDNRSLFSVSLAKIIKNTNKTLFIMN